jgi:ferrous iron transport protein B
LRCAFDGGQSPPERISRQEFASKSLQSIQYGTKHIAAKEAVLGTLGTAYSLGEVKEDETGPLAERLRADPVWSKATALALMLFVLLYSPCFVALVIIRQEAGSWGWVAFSMIFNTFFAYAVAVGVFQAGRLIWG